MKYIPFSNYEDSGRVDFGFSNENVKLSPGNVCHFRSFFNTTFHEKNWFLVDHP